MVAAAVPLLSTAATAGAGATAAAGTLGTLATVASIGTSLFAGYQGWQASRAEAAQYTAQADAERVRAIQEEANRQARLTEILNAQMANTAGRGIQVGSGSDIAIASFSEEEAQRESDIASLDSKFKINQLNMSKSQAKKSGTASLISGVGNAVGTGYDTYTRAVERNRTINK